VLLCLLSQSCFAAHWQAIGRPKDSSLGYAYVDLDSLRPEGIYRVAMFLTIYPRATVNANSIKLDRIAQETGFDCSGRTFALISTVGYLGGKEAGSSSNNGVDWKDHLRTVPQDVFSQRALDLVCNSPLPTHHNAASPDESPGTVHLTIPTPG